MPYLIRSLVRRAGSSQQLSLCCYLYAGAGDWCEHRQLQHRQGGHLPASIPKSDRLVLVFFLTVGADPHATEEAIRLFDCAVFDLRLRSS